MSAVADKIAFAAELGEICASDNETDSTGNSVGQ